MDVPFGDPGIRISERESQQRDRCPGNRESWEHVHAADVTNQRDQEKGPAEPETERLGRKPWSGQAVRVLVEPQAVEGRRDDHERQATQEAEERVEEEPLSCQKPCRAYSA